MSPLLSISSIHDVQKSRQFYSLLLLIRLLIPVLIGWQIYTHSDFSQIYNNQTVYTALAIYSGFSLLNFLLVIFQPTRTVFFYTGVMLDWLLAISFPFLLPNQADITVAIAVLFMVSAFNDLKFKFLLGLSISYLVSAIMAGWIYQTLESSQLHTAHIAGIIIFALGYLYCLKDSFKQSSSGLTSNSPLALQQKHLSEGLGYLYPYHQRNQIPLSLLMIRTEKLSRQQRGFIDQLMAAYKTRLRKSDLLVQINVQHVAVLLCDTSPTQASHLVRALSTLHQNTDYPEIRLSYGVCALPLDQPIALDDILEQMMMSLSEAENQQTNRLIFINAKQSDSFSKN